MVVTKTEAVAKGLPLVAQMANNPPAMQETWVRSLSWEDPLEKGRATHSSILAWRIPWTEESDGLQSRGSQSWPQLKQVRKEALFKYLLGIRTWSDHL